MTWEMLLTTETAAAQLGVSPAAILRYYHSGILRGQKHGRYVLVEQRAVLALMGVMKWVREGKRTPPRRGKSATPASAPAANAVPATPGPDAGEGVSQAPPASGPASDNGLSQAG